MCENGSGSLYDRRTWAIRKTEENVVRRAERDAYDEWVS